MVLDFIDTFNRTGPGIGNNWVLDSLAETYATLVDNTVNFAYTGLSTDIQYMAQLNILDIEPNKIVEATIKYNGSLGGGTGAILIPSFQDTENYVGLEIFRAATGAVRFVKLESGVRTVLATYSGVSGLLTNFQTWGIFSKKGMYIASVNGVEILRCFAPTIPHTNSPALGANVTSSTRPLLCSFFRSYNLSSREEY